MICRGYTHERKQCTVNENLSVMGFCNDHTYYRNLSNTIKNKIEDLDIPIDQLDLQACLSCHKWNLKIDNERSICNKCEKMIQKEEKKKLLDEKNINKRKKVKIGRTCKAYIPIGERDNLEIIQCPTNTIFADGFCTPHFKQYGDYNDNELEQMKNGELFYCSRTPGHFYKVDNGRLTCDKHLNQNNKSRNKKNENNKCISYENKKKKCEIEQFILNHKNETINSCNINEKNIRKNKKQDIINRYINDHPNDNIEFINEEDIIKYYCSIKIPCKNNKKNGTDYCENHKYISEYTEKQKKFMDFCSSCCKYRYIPEGKKTCGC